MYKHIHTVNAVAYLELQFTKTPHECSSVPAVKSHITDLSTENNYVEKSFI